MATPDLDAIRDRIKQYADNNGLSVWALAASAGLHRNSLRDLDTAAWNPRWKTIQRCLDLVEGRPRPKPRKRTKRKAS